AVFAALLDPERGGSFELAPVAEFTAERRYLEGTNVLETVYRTGEGAVRLVDALTLQRGALLPWVEVARRVEGLEGSVELRWRVTPRFDWARGKTRIRLRRGVPVAEDGDAGVLVGIHAWDAGEPVVGEAEGKGSFRAVAGSRALLALVACDSG